MGAREGPETSCCSPPPSLAVRVPRVFILHLLPEQIETRDQGMVTKGIGCVCDAGRGLQLFEEGRMPRRAAAGGAGIGEIRTWVISDRTPQLPVLACVTPVALPP